MVWLGLSLLVFILQDGMLFHPMPLRSPSAQHLDQTAQAWTVEHEAGSLRGWILHPERNRLLLYFGGNAEEVSETASFWEELQDYAVCLVNYRGYGASDGKPGEQALCEDALRLYDSLQSAREDEGIVVVGRSLGSGVAVHLASQRSLDAVVLITPYDSLLAVAQGRFPLLPIRWMMRHPMDSLSRARGVKAPSLFLVAGEDEVIPPIHARRLYDQWEGPRQWELFESAGHNDLELDPHYDEVLRAFLAKTAVAK